jgi:hypothetical protein
MNAQTYTARKIDNMYHKFTYQQRCPGVIEIWPSSQLLQGITLPKNVCCCFFYVNQKSKMTIIRGHSFKIWPYGKMKNIFYIIIFWNQGSIWRETWLECAVGCPYQNVLWVFLVKMCGFCVDQKSNIVIITESKLTLDPLSKWKK